MSNNSVITTVTFKLDLQHNWVDLDMLFLIHLLDLNDLVENYDLVIYTRILGIYLFIKEAHKIETPESLKVNIQ